MGRKVTHGLRSVVVTVPENTVIEQGKFYLLDGFLGMALQSVTTGPGQTAKVVLEIEPAEYETDQLDPAGTFNVGARIYWDAVNQRFTEVAANNRFAGVVTKAKGTGSVIEFALAPQVRSGLTQAAAQPDSTAADVATLRSDFNALLQKLRDAGLMAV